MRSILETKIHRPSVAAELIPRPRLMERLDRALVSARFMLVCAPAGYGKTTTIATWLDHLAGQESADHQVLRQAWYSLDQNDNDLGQFLKYLVAAIRLAWPGMLPGMWQLAADADLPDAVAILALFNQELEALPGRTILVLDDFHLITDPDIHNFLAVLLRHSPTGLFPVITTRNDLPFSTSLWRGRNELDELRASDLTFSSQETLDFVRETVADDFPTEMAAQLHDRTEGWAAGVRLAGLSMSVPADRDEILDALSHATHRHIVDYLVDEVLDRQPPERQRFLLMTSVLDRMNSELCAAALDTTDVARCQATLVTLERQNAFIIALDARRGWYRYHHLFQSLLRARLASWCSPADIAAIHRRAAEWLAGRDLVEEALSHYQAAGDTSAMISLMECRIADLQNREDWATLERWLNRFPRDVVENHPALLLAEAWLHQQRIWRETLWFTLDRVVALLEQPDCPWPPETTRRYWAEVHALRSSHFYRYLSIAERSAAGRLAMRDLPQDKAWIRGFVLLNLMYQVHDETSRVENFRRIEAELRAVGSGSPAARIRILFAKLGMIYSYGLLPDLRLPAEEMLNLAGRIDMSTTVAYGHIALGMISYQANELDEAIEHLQFVVREPYRTNITNFLMAAYPLVAAYTATARHDQCDEILKVVQLRRLTAFDPLMREELDRLEVFIAFKRGDYATASRWAERSFLPVEPTLHHNKPFTLAEIWLAGGTPKHWQAAKAELEGYITLCEAVYERLQHIRALVLLAIAEWQLGQTRPALDHLAAAIEMGYARGYRRWYIDQGPIMGEMLHALAREGGYVEETGVLLALLAASADRPAGPAAAPLEAAGLIGLLSDRELDILKCLQAGLSNKEIARRLVISPLTVRNHTSHIYHKLAVHNRRQAVARARVLGLIS